MNDLAQKKIPRWLKVIFGILTIIISTLLSAYFTPCVTSFIANLCNISKNSLTVSSMLVGSFTLALNYIFELIYLVCINSCKVLDSSLTTSSSGSNVTKLKIGQDVDVEWHVLFTGKKVFKSEKSVFVEFPDWLDITVKGNEFLKNDMSCPNKYLISLEKLIDNEVTLQFSLTPKYTAETSASTVTSNARIKYDGIKFFRRKNIKDMTIMFIK